MSTRTKRRKRYLEIDVVTAARQRIEEMLDTFDEVIVSFSGGKDSLVTLVLLADVLRERGVNIMEHPIKTLFLDHEVLDPAIIAFVERYRALPWLDLRWLCTQFESSMFVLGEVRDFLCWDPDRPWFRPMPEGAVTSDHPLNGAERRAVQIDGLRGRVCILVGVRTDESLARLAGVMACPATPHIAKCKESKRALLGKPIYDWSENDILKFLSERAIDWCSVYDSQHAAGSMLRVSTPLHSATSKKLEEQAAQDPVFYDRLLEFFPEMRLQARYWKDYRSGMPAMQEKYASLGWKGVYACLNDTVTNPAQKSHILKQLHWCESRARTAPEAYPPEYLIQQILRGFSHGKLMPARRTDQRMFAARQERRVHNGHASGHD